MSYQFARLCKEVDEIGRCNNYCEGNTDYCASHNAQHRKMERLAKKAPKKPKPIPRRSQKMDVIMEEYNRRRPGYLAGKKCAVFPDQKANQIHHKMGRIGYADVYAEENDIPLILDERFWLPVSQDGHDKIERNPDWAKDKGFSFERLKTTSE